MFIKRGLLPRAMVLALLLAGSALHELSAQKIVTWNIEWFPGRVRNSPTVAQQQEQMKACQDELRKINPDIFIAQEMGDWQAFEDLCAAVPGLRVHVVSAFRDPGTGALTRQQIGIASKLKAISAWAEPWEIVAPDMARGFSFAALQSPSGDGLLMVYGVHFKSNRGGEDPQEAERNGKLRDEAVQQLLRHQQAMQPVFEGQQIKGWVIAGDFNTNQDNQFKDSVIVVLTADGYWNSWTDVPREERLTWRGDRRGFHEPTTFDHIITKSLGKPKAQLLPVSPTTSDHWPVAVDLGK